MDIADAAVGNRVTLARAYTLHGSGYASLGYIPTPGTSGRVTKVDPSDGTVHVDYEGPGADGALLWTDVACLEEWMDDLPDLTNLDETKEWLDAEPQRP